MTSQCPQCGQAISDDFGVVVCPHCQAVLFVDLNGNIQLNSANEILEQAAEQEEAVFVEEPSMTPPEGLSLEEDPQAFQETQFGTLARFQNPNPEPALEPLLQNETFEQPIEPPVEPATIENEGFEAEEEDEDPEQVIQGVGEFEESDLSPGPLTYTVTIEGIDTKNLRVQLQEALDDPKFQWSSSEIIRKIRLGKITLKNLAPVKASVLISRIKDLPLKISWTQQVFK
jgi:hypothetical protein